MPFHDSPFPSILRERSKRESLRLLESAPEMLAALKRLSLHVEEGNDDYDAIGEARRAIAKAEGLAR